MNETNQSFWIHENPIAGKCGLSSRFFSIPRRCGHCLTRSPEHYHSRGMPRPFPDHPRILFQYTISGGGEFRKDGKSTPLNPGDALLIQLPDQVEYLRPDHQEAWEFLYVSFWHPYAVAMFQELIPQSGNVLHPDPDGNTIRCLWELFRLFMDGGAADFDPYSAADAGYRFILQITREAVSGKSGSGKLFPRVQAYCNCHLNSPVTTEELAVFCGYSRGHFTKLFRQETGMTPLDYVLKQKLESAVRILQTEQISVKELAARCGFQDQGYFTRRFRSVYHVTPGKYLKLI